MPRKSMKDMSPEEQLEQKLESLGRALRGLEGASEWLSKHSEVVPSAIYPVLIQEIENKTGYCLTVLRSPGQVPERSKGSFADAVLMKAASEEKPANRATRSAKAKK